MPPKRKTQTQMGLGWKHQQQRARLMSQHVDGSPCWWCDQPMYKDRERNWDYNPEANGLTSGCLAADHSLARAHGGKKADRLLHGLCNKQRGTGEKDHERPAVTGDSVSVADDERAKWTLLDW